MLLHDALYLPDASRGRFAERLLTYAGVHETQVYFEFPLLPVAERNIYN